MHETYFVTVMTGDGVLSKREETHGGLVGLCYVLLRLFNHYWLAFEDTEEYKTVRGSGTQSSASHSPLPTES